MPAKVFSRALLPTMIATALASTAVYAQGNDECVELEGTPPGLYATSDQGRIFLIKDGEVVELGPGEASFADESSLKCIKIPPKFLDWPCGTEAALGRMFNTYTIDDLKTDNQMKEIVQRYFDVPEVLTPILNWVDGEYSAIFPYNDILQFSSPEYWYLNDSMNSVMNPKRPRSLLLSLYVGTNQVVIDNNIIDALRAELGSDQIPVAFLFNDSNTVPVSYYGANATLEEVLKGFIERGIKVAEAPMWWLGDYSLKPTITEFEKYFDIPALDDISAEKQASLRLELETYGFSRKPLLVNVLAGSDSMVLDQPERARVAASLGMGLQTALFFIEEDAHLARCGPGTPVDTSGIAGATTPISGPSVTPDSPASLQVPAPLPASLPAPAPVPAPVPVPAPDPVSPS